MMLPYRRHSNGRAKLFGDKADCSRDTITDQFSQIHGDSSVNNSSVHASYLENAITSRAQMVNAVVIDATVRGYQWKWAVLNGTRIRKVHVDGECFLGEWILDGPFYIRSGVWTQPPKHKILSHESGIHVGLTESTEGKAFIACEEKLVTDWLRMGLRIGKWLQWPDSLAREAYYFMQELADEEIINVGQLRNTANEAAQLLNA